jgi:hypothetical protein
MANQAPADPVDLLNGMATQLSQVASQIQQLRLEGQAEAERNRQMRESLDTLRDRVNTHDSMLTGELPSHLARNVAIAQPHEWVVQPGSSDGSFVTEERVAEMISQALLTKVAPALTHAFQEVGTQLQSTNARVQTLEEEVRALRIRTAWAEKDLMYSQIEAAKRTITTRNWPTWMTEDDRLLTVQKALYAEGISQKEWELTTLRTVDENNVNTLAPLSILTVRTFAQRRQLIQNASRIDLWYWKEKTSSTTTPASQGEAAPPSGTASTAAPGSGMVGSAGDAAGDGASTAPKAYEATWCKGPPIKLAPGITQFERRLGAPMHGLMNAYQQTFSKYKKETLAPRWKTLILEDAANAWLGRIKYVRVQCSQTSNTGNMSDWKCVVQIPEEHKDRLLTVWKDIWYSQLKTQILQTDVETSAIDKAAEVTSQSYAEAPRLSKFLSKSVPHYDAGSEQGLEQWVARFRYEYPWPLEFQGLTADHPDRRHFQNMRNVEDLMEEMAAQQEAHMTAEHGETLESMVTPADPPAPGNKGTKRPPPSETSEPQDETSQASQWFPFTSEDDAMTVVELERARWQARGKTDQFPISDWIAWVKQRYPRGSTASQWSS